MRWSRDWTTAYGPWASQPAPTTYSNAARSQRASVRAPSSPMIHSVTSALRPAAAYGLARGGLAGSAGSAVYQRSTAAESSPGDQQPAAVRRPPVPALALERRVGVLGDPERTSGPSGRPRSPGRRCRPRRSPGASRRGGTRSAGPTGRDGIGDRPGSAADAGYRLGWRWTSRVHRPRRQGERDEPGRECRWRTRRSPAGRRRPEPRSGRRAGAPCRCRRPAPTGRSPGRRRPGRGGTRRSPRRA